VKSSYYTAGPERAQKVRELFERIAARYDLINDLQSGGLHRAWKRRLVRAAAPTANDQALDLCCGTGDIARHLFTGGTRVVGCDFSSGMLAEAQRRNPEIPFIQGDALHLPFPDERFDIVTIGYGLRNLANLREGIDEILRVAKPGARILVLDFAKPRNRAWRKVYFTYLRLVVPLFGRIFAGNAAAYAYILDSLESYPAQDQIAALLRDAGCAQVKIHEFLGGIMSLHCGRKAGERI
jgi:demethylmenaquinone methyltransferase/2-methoxy-6-polyprenyl-1,4-benzoquinol methylase